MRRYLSFRVVIEISLNVFGADGESEQTVDLIGALPGSVFRLCHSVHGFGERETQIRHVLNRFTSKFHHQSPVKVIGCWSKYANDVNLFLTFQVILFTQDSIGCRIQ